MTQHVTGHPVFAQTSDRRSGFHVELEKSDNLSKTSKSADISAELNVSVFVAWLGVGVPVVQEDAVIEVNTLNGLYRTILTVLGTCPASVSSVGILQWLPMLGIAGIFVAWCGASVCAGNQ